MFIHPCVVSRLVVDVGAINHKMRIRAVFVVNDVVIGDESDDVLDEPVGQSWLLFKLLPVCLPLFPKELFELVQDSLINWKLVVFNPLPELFHVLLL